MQKKRKPNKSPRFRERVLTVVAHIPEGEALTYGEVAKRAGNSKAARGVGAIMKANDNPSIPCHRVVRKDGIGGYNRGVQLKQRRLRQEGYLR